MYCRDKAHITVLRNVNLQVQQGELVGICGSVGSGKSSLLSAGALCCCQDCLSGVMLMDGGCWAVRLWDTVLNQMRVLNGTVATRGTFAYVAQQVSDCSYVS